MKANIDVSRLYFIRGVTTFYIYKIPLAISPISLMD